MALTDVQIRQAKPAEKPYRLADRGGLFLEVRPNGSKFWRYAYRIEKKSNLYAIGAYPATSLQQARDEHTKARALVKLGHHPAHERQRARLLVVELNRETFKVTAEEWFDSKRTIPAEGKRKERKGWSQEYEDKVRGYLDAELFPRLGSMPLRSIKTVDVADVIGRIEKRGTPTVAILVRQITSQVFYHGIANGRADFDPAFVMRRQNKRKVRKVKHKTPLSPQGIELLLKRLKTSDVNPARSIAIQLLLRLFVRTKELRQTPWSEILPALKTSLWEIPGHRMKMGRNHLVPLTPQVVSLFEDLYKLTGDGEFLFPHFRDKKIPMGPDGVNYVLRSIGYPNNSLSGHAFRATASTLLNGMGFREEHVDMQLAHSDEDAYNQALYLPERIEIMKAWSDRIDRIGRGEEGVEDTAPVQQALAA